MNHNYIEIYEGLDKDTCEALILEHKKQEENNALIPGQTAGLIEKDVRNSLDLFIYESPIQKPIPSDSQVIIPDNPEPNELVQKVFKQLWKNVAKYMNKYTLTDGMDFWSNVVLPTQPKEKIKYVSGKPKFTANLVGEMLQKERCNIIIQKHTKNEGHAYAWHEDSGNGAERYITAMFYLNDVEEGGETEFYHQELKIKPKQGNMIIFPPYYTHMHRGNVPLSNDKYTVSIFLHRPGQFSGRMV